MANDVYIKFGNNDDDPDPGDRELPLYEGDSTDSKHLWWCELRDCGFDMESPQQADENSDPPAKAVPTTFRSVTIKKRVDWASTQLFELCCQAAMNSVGKPILDKDKVPQTGVIDQVTVEVCRPAGGEKVACARVIYTGVIITKYAVSLSGPEPAESITFEFKKVKFFYYQTSPYTGELVDEQGKRTEDMDNHDEETQPPGGGGSGDEDGETSGGSQPGSGVPNPALAAAGNVGLPTTPGSSPDSTVTVNFPGLWQGNGFGLLPD